ETMTTAKNTEIGKKRFCKLFSLVLFVFFVVPCGFCHATPHPFHDDGGLINWRPNWASALQTAQKTGKPLFIEAGTEGDGNCRQLALTTLRDPIVALTINRHFVPVVIDSGKAPPEIKEMFNRVEGKAVPYLLFVTDHGQFLTGTGGLREPKK